MIQKRKKHLSKYDAPLSIQFGWGYKAFKKGSLDSRLKRNTMQHREWQRGWNTAYFENLKKVKQHEQTRARS